MNVKYLDAQQRASDVGGGFGAVVEGHAHACSQPCSASVPTGDHQEATAGIIIAGSIISARALAPVDLAIAHWRSFVGFRQSWRRLNDLLTAFPPENAQLALPKPGIQLFGGRRQRRSPRRQAGSSCRNGVPPREGDGLGIIGPSASRQIVPCACPGRGLAAGAGTIRLDGAALDQWPAKRWPPHRLSAAGRGAVLRHRRAEHRPASRPSRTGGRCASRRPRPPASMK